MKQLGHEGGGLVNEISALVKETCLRLPPHKVTKEWNLSMKEASPYRHQVHSTLILDIPSSKSVR